jgi:hypothetical protein
VDGENMDVRKWNLKDGGYDGRSKMGGRRWMREDGRQEMDTRRWIIGNGTWEDKD